MRTTLDIDDDVLAAAKELARQQGVSAGAAVSALIRQALLGTHADRQPSKGRLPDRATAIGGFRPFPSRGKAVTNDLIHTLRDNEGV